MHHDTSLNSGAGHHNQERPLHIRAAFSCFCSDVSGSTAVEYTLIAAMIGLGLVGGLVTFQQDLVASLGEITNTILKY